MYVYVNDSIVSAEQAKVSAFDHGYMYGLGLFETFRVEDGHPFLLDDHFRRLDDGLRSLGIEWSMKREQAITIIQDLLEANQLNSAYVRWNVSAGPHELGLYTGTYSEPTTIIYMKSLPTQLNGVKDAVILSIKRNTPEGDIRLKSHHYLNNVLAKRELGAVGNVEGIFLNGSGYVAEGIVSNVFWIKNNTVYTPAIETGILDGITRQFVLTLLKQQGVSAQIGLYKPEELLSADAAFVTNSIQEVVPLRSCNEKQYNSEHELIASLSKEFDRYRQWLWSRYELQGGKQ
ncbi:aminodeoxychorismate lyase [Halalkalibacter nanhaiisediminis]|uniref:aminodeoxychorismate lyase n=1 Tax=Halalkalibacter nanhaiisediminis TaxID=688079 RepID=A0A562Q8Z5_9BACI|nr:aminodeoxychorismate lyase [Halalkalibacter nanhaiisediminis]TWI53203.1 4-amino-4-deoxychorismate lyase [Halalkalibacter nanhaiisediminis]